MTGYTVTVEPFGPTTAGYWYVRAGKDLDKRLRGCTQKTVIEKLEELGRLDYFVEHHQERIEFHELNVEFYQCSNWKAVRTLDLGLPSWRLYDNGQSDHCGIFPRT
jgi:hypothetical protein